MNDLTLSQQVLARHMIEWSLIPPVLTDNLPTDIPGSARYLDMAISQEARLVKSLGANPRCYTVFLQSGMPVESFFFQQRRALSWMDGADVEAAVLEDFLQVRQDIVRLQKTLDVWKTENTSPASDGPLTPLTSIKSLNQMFSGLSVFATDVLEAHEDALGSAVQKFYDLEARRSRGIGQRVRRSGRISILPERSEVVLRDQTKVG